jgi:hypothetical protein
MACEPTQTGTYIFEAFDSKTFESKTIARFLKKNRTATITSDGMWVGGCRRFIAAGEPILSRLKSDSVLSFSGFSNREKTKDLGTPYQRWTSSTNASIRVTAPPDTKCEVQMRLLSSCPRELEPTDAFVLIAGERIPLVFDEGEWEGTHAVTPNAGSGEGFEIELHSRTWRPADYRPSRDSRTLGLLLDQLEVRFTP